MIRKPITSVPPYHLVYTLGSLFGYVSKMSSLKRVANANPVPEKDDEAAEDGEAGDKRQKPDDDVVEAPCPFTVVYDRKEFSNTGTTEFNTLVTFSEEHINLCIARARETGKKQHVVVMTDVSFSMEGGGIEGAQTGIRQLYKALVDNDPSKQLPFVVHFNTFHGSAQPWEENNCNITMDQLEAKCEEYASTLYIPTDSNGTNHQDAIRSSFAYLNRFGYTPDNTKHIILITDGDATAGERNPARLKLEMEEKLKAVGAEEIVVHCIVVGEGVNREVPKNLCATTGGIVAFARDPRNLSEELSQVCGPIKEAPRAIVLEMGFGDERAIKRFGLMTNIRRRVLLNLEHNSSPIGQQTIFTVANRGTEHKTVFDVKAESELASFVVPKDIQDELTAFAIEKKMAEDAEQAMRLQGAHAMANLARAATVSQPVVALPQHIQDRFIRRAVASERMATIMSAPDEPESQSDDCMDANDAGLRMDSMMSQSNY